MSEILLSCYNRGECMDYMTELTAIAKTHGGIIETKTAAHRSTAEQIADVPGILHNIEDSAELKACGTSIVSSLRMHRILSIFCYHLFCNKRP